MPSMSTRSGRPGPVVVAISEEMQKRLANVPDIGPAEVLPANPAPEAMPRVMKMLAAAKKPLVVLGGSRWSEQGKADIRDWLLANDLPVSVAFRRMGLFDGTSANYVGDLGVGADGGLVAKAKELTSFSPSAPASANRSAGLHTARHGGRRRSSMSIRTRRRSGASIARRSASSRGECLRRRGQGSRGGGKPAWAGWTRSCARCAPRRCRRITGPLNLRSALQELEAVLPRTPSSPPTPAISPPGRTASIHFSEKQDFLGRPTARWGIRCRRRSARRSRIRPHRVAFVGDGGFMMTGRRSRPPSIIR